jgi:hypothetical protein
VTLTEASANMGDSKQTVTSLERVQSPGEEIANSVSAGVGLIGAIAGIPLLLAFRKPTGQQLACCRCVGLRCDDPLALSRVHDLSRAAAKQSKAALSVTRSYGNLSSDCRNLHAVRWCLCVPRVFRTERVNLKMPVIAQSFAISESNRNSTKRV